MNFLRTSEQNKIPRRWPLAVLVVLSTMGLANCGGSASETPPPVEPDPRAVLSSSTVRTDARGSVDRNALAPSNEVVTDETSARSASTWGTASRQPVTPRYFSDVDAGPLH
jgi:hypothetical protein